MEWRQRVITVLAGSLVALVVLSNNERAGRAQTPPGDTVAVTRDVMIPMRDGVRLATDIYFPARDGIALEERRPVILERTKSQRGSGTFSGIAPIPVIRGKTPTDLDAGRKVLLEVWNGEADKTDERRHARNFDGPEPEAIPVECRLKLTRQRIAPFSRQRRNEVLHNSNSERAGLRPWPRRGRWPKSEFNSQDWLGCLTGRFG
jgi:hypothetical protein